MTASTADLARIAEPLPRAGALRPTEPLLPVEALLRKQRTLTAVERFSKVHDDGAVPAQSRYYRDLIPTQKPGKNQQYAFEVDLDACTGCKACVAGCHSLNGLDADESWRTVGLLHGGTVREPYQQTVTTSCHHCVDPACMSGCPVQAYEKDPITGIVKHLDDQCFGCQYCTLMCPYDAPKYNPARGVVRKCDMCSDRLAHGEAPACVQACPNEAIAIRVVDQSFVVELSDAGNFLPGTAAPDHTLPTTRYKTERALPANLLPGDFYRTEPQHSHPPLVVMLTLTQLSVGAFLFSALVERLSGIPAGSPIAQVALACSLALIALAASVFHLGRPWLAWRAFLGLRTSWLSREAIAFGLFAQLALAYGALTAVPLLAVPRLWEISRDLAPALRLGAAGMGVLGVFFSVMVYVATKRPQWSGTLTSVRFFGTTIALGAASVLAVCTVTAPSLARSNRAVLALPSVIVAAVVVKLCLEAWILLHVRRRPLTIHKRVATLMLGDLRDVTVLRIALALVGGILLPLYLEATALSARAGAVSIVSWVFLGASELAERYLFFRAAPASRMPGGLA